MSLWQLMLQRGIQQTHSVWLDSPTGHKFVEDESYLEIRLRSMQLARQKRLWTSRFATAYACVESLTAWGRQESLSLVGPDRLKALDPKHLSRVAILNERIWGPSPYRGDQVTLTLGLCAIQEGNVLRAFVRTLGTISSATAPQLSVAARISTPLLESLESLLELDQTVELVLGQRRTFSSRFNEGTLIILRTADPTLADAKFSVREDGSVYADGELLSNCDAIVLDLCFRATRDDWRALPQVRDSLQNLTQAALGAPDAQFEQSCRAAVSAILLCDELIAAQQITLANSVREQALALRARKLSLGIGRQDTLGEGFSPWLDQPAKHSLTREQLLSFCITSRVSKG